MADGEHIWIEYPTADAVAYAIVAAARRTDEDPIACAQGQYGSHCRHYAAHALRRVYPLMLTSTLARVVGSGSPHSFWTQSDRCVRYGTFKWWDARIVVAVEAELRVLVGRPMRPTRTVETLNMRRAAVPAAANVTAALMGDPPANRVRH